MDFSLLLSDDMWAQVGLHVKPRHLFKLMLTCKRIRRAVDTERYWTRVAAHLVWRGSEHMELVSREHPMTDDRMPPIDEAYNLYYLIGLDRGYYHGMEMFLRRIQETIDAYGRPEEEEEPGPWFAKFHEIVGLRERTIRMYAETTGLDWFGWRMPTLQGDESRISMKELARRMTVFEWVDRTKAARNGWPRMQRFVFEMEDDPMPSVYKRRIFRQLNRLVWGLLEFDLEEEQAPMIPMLLTMEACIF